MGSLVRLAETLRSNIFQLSIVSNFLVLSDLFDHYRYQKDRDIEQHIRFQLDSSGP